MDAVRFDLLPFLRVRFGARLHEHLESVFLVWRGEYEVFLETTTLDSRGERRVDVQANSLSDALDAPSAAEAILATLSMDDYSWIMVGDVFPEDEARRIARRAEGEAPESEARAG